MGQWNFLTNKLDILSLLLLLPLCTGAGSEGEHPGAVPGAAPLLVPHPFLTSIRNQHSKRRGFDPLVHLVLLSAASTLPTGVGPEGQYQGAVQSATSAGQGAGEERADGAQVWKGCGSG